jgi:uncharacterized protein (DUF3084 family)
MGYRVSPNGVHLDVVCLFVKELEADLAAAASKAAEKDAELADAAEVAEVLTDELERLQAAADKDAEQHQQQARAPFIIAKKAARSSTLALFVAVT